MPLFAEMQSNSSMDPSNLVKTFKKSVTSNHGDCYLHRNNPLKLAVKGGQLEDCNFLFVLPF